MSQREHTICNQVKTNKVENKKRQRTRKTQEVVQHTFCCTLHAARCSRLMRATHRSATEPSSFLTSSGVLSMFDE